VPNRSSTSGRDLNQLAARIVPQATTDESTDRSDGKDPAAVALGRRGGLKGGKARADKLSPDRRREIARKAAAKRWGRQE